MATTKHPLVLQAIRLTIVVAVLCPSAVGKIIYVDDDAAGTNDGTSWANAYVYLQDALAAAQASTKPVEIRVAQGQYRPDQGMNQTLGDREATFRLLDGVTLAGGCAGAGTADPNTRDVETYQTILSGDIGADGDARDNSYHVVEATGVDAAELGGFTIMRGNAALSGDENSDPNDRRRFGGGMYIENASPRVVYCLFRENTALRGGGTYSLDGSPTLDRCTFSRNRAVVTTEDSRVGQGMRSCGGGMCAAGGSPALTDCNFVGNSAVFEGSTMMYAVARVGGGMYSDGSDVCLLNCTFSDNSAFDSGGGMANVGGSGTIDHCTFTGNTVDSRYGFGGGMANSTGCPVVYGSTFTGNSGARGAGMSNHRSQPTLIACRFTDNGPGKTGVSPPLTLTDNWGAGMYNYDSAPTLVECVFEANVALGNGGGIFNSYGSDATLVGCTFGQNSAANGGGVYDSESSPTLDQCAFSDNSAEDSGGGMFNVYSQPVLTACTFSDNSAVRGGGMYNSGSDPNLDYCLFSHNSAVEGGGMCNIQWNFPALNHCAFLANSAAQDGGGMYNPESVAGMGGGRSDPLRLTHCLFTGNSSGRNGGGMFNGGIVTLAHCTFADNRAADSGGNICQDLLIYNWRASYITNSIFCGGTPPDVLGSLQAVYSNLQGGIQGEGNIDADPLFAAAGYWDPNGTPDDPNDDFWVDGDYHLKSQAGRWDSNSQSWVTDSVTSPCIDAGDPNSPIGDEPMLNGGRVNMGVYGGTAEASRSPIWLLPPLPGQASMPSPPDGATGLWSEPVVLSWNAGAYGLSHDVYFGTDDPPPFVCNQSAARYDPGALQREATYYWRIDEVNRSGKTTGPIWRFDYVGKGRGCFTGETLVWVDGRLMPISQVGPRIRVRLAGSGRAKVPQPLGRVEKLLAHEGTYTCYDVLFESGHSICVAECHFFLAESGRWVPLQALTRGTRLQTPTGAVAVASVTERTTSYVGTVYNLVVPGSHRYLVGKDAVIARDY